MSFYRFIDDYRDLCPVFKHKFYPGDVFIIDKNNVPFLDKIVYHCDNNGQEIFYNSVYIVIAAIASISTIKYTFMSKFGLVYLNSYVSQYEISRNSVWS